MWSSSMSPLKISWRYEMWSQKLGIVCIWCTQDKIILVYPSTLPLCIQGFALCANRLKKFRNQCWTNQLISYEVKQSALLDIHFHSHCSHNIAFLPFECLCLQPIKHGIHHQHQTSHTSHSASSSQRCVRRNMYIIKNAPKEKTYNARIRHTWI